MPHTNACHRPLALCPGAQHCLDQFNPLPWGLLGNLLSLGRRPPSPCNLLPGNTPFLAPAWQIPKCTNTQTKAKPSILQMEKNQNASFFRYLFPISFVCFFFASVSKVSFPSQILQQSQFSPTAARLVVHEGRGTEQMEQTEQKAHLRLCLKLGVSLATWRTWYIS